MKSCHETVVINDPGGQNHNPASGDQYFHLKIDLFLEILKSGNGRRDADV